jgi:hypothetical protein
MRKIIFGILIIILMIGSTFVGATVTNIETIPAAKIVNVTIPIGEYKIIENDQFYEFKLENFGKLLIPGKPDLPSKIFSIAIPPGAIISGLSYNKGKEIVLEGKYKIQPVNLPRVIGEENPENYQNELIVYYNNYETSYGSDNIYPNSVVEFVRTAGYREFNLVDIRINPFAFHPISGKVIFYPDITVSVSYTFPKGYTPKEVTIENIERSEKFAEEIILNYNEVKEWYSIGLVGRETYDYVIITLDSLDSSIQALVDLEEGKGKNVYVATIDWIDTNYDGYDLQEKIRNFLRDKYPSDEWGILDVCLIGDYDDVPMRLCAQNVGYGQPKTDYYYAELSLPDSESWDKNGNHQYGENSDTIDFYAEVNIGRIPWSDPDIVEHICEKSSAYEQNYDPSFKKNILLLGAFFWPDTDNAVLMEKKVDQEWMTDWTMTRMYEDAQSSYQCDYDLSYANVQTVWSANTYGFVDWAGHGSPTGCYEYYPSQPFVDTATCTYLNDDYPSIIFADACSNSDTEYNNIGKMMMKQGAIGFLGATQVAYGMGGWNNPYSGSSQSLDYFFTTCCTSGEYTQGEAQQWALNEMYTNGLWYYTYYETFEWGALWGNPDLQMGVASRPPETPAKPSGPTNWTIDVAATYDGTTTDPEGDSIYYLFNWGDGTNSGWVGPYISGEKGSASHTWSELGNYEVKVKARDEYGVQSDWSESVQLSIIPNIPPKAPTIIGPRSGTQSKLLNLKFTATDPENQDLYYWINWGGDEYPETFGPYSSGKVVTISHSWGTVGNYTINARTIDQYGAKSSITTYKVRITKSRAITNHVLLLQNIIDHFPILKSAIYMYMEKYYYGI